MRKTFQPPQKSMKDNKTAPRAKKRHKKMSNYNDKILINPSKEGNLITYKLDTTKYDLLQIEIIGSVTIRDGKITELTKPYVNDNGNAIEKDELLKCYRGYIGRAVYKEHIETPDKPYGFVIDSKIVVKPLSKDDATTTVQLLLAIDKETSLQVQLGEYKFSSFGLFANVKKMGDVELLKDVYFTEASLVKRPAYGGATASILYKLDPKEIPYITFQVSEDNIKPTGHKEVDIHIVIDKMATRQS